mgnify:FL=1
MNESDGEKRLLVDDLVPSADRVCVTGGVGSVSDTVSVLCGFVGSVRLVDADSEMFFQDSV